MKRVAVVGDGKKTGVRKAAAEVRDWLPGRAEVVLVDLEGRADLAALEADFLLVFGGDGFLLSVARRLGGRPVPVMGVNFGKLGFIAEYSEGEVREGVERFLAGRALVSSRMMLRVHREGGGPPRLALNDAVITGGANPRMIYVEVTLDGERDLNYAGDGLIISTPTGSTAHSLTAGGPILTPGMEGVVLTPICAQALTTRPLVIPAAMRLRVTLRTDGPGGMMTLDGQEVVSLASGDTVTVEGVPGAFLLVRDPGRGFLDILREKLGWGVLPAYERRFHPRAGDGGAGAGSGPPPAGKE